jgi:MFS family permease
MVLVRSISKRDLVSAMAWVTTPALIGPVLGPPVGGFITTYASWHWIFLINVPIGLVGIVLATRYIDDIRAETRERFDTVGMVLAGLGIAGVAFGLSILGLNFLPLSVVAALVIGGICFIVAYLMHARHTPNPALDLTLFRIPTFYASVTGGFIFRLGLGALPFLLPLMLQVGFGFSPFQSGSITFATALGAMGMKWATSRMLRRFGFRNILIYNGLISAAFLAVCAAFTVNTPLAVMVGLLFIGGFFRSLQFTSINTIAYADVDHVRVSKATALASVSQQLSVSAGVAIGAMCVELAVQFRGGGDLVAADFPPAFLIVASISALSALIFFRLPADAGAEMANRMPIPAEPPDPPR